jgi:hypothetical protein
MSEFGKDYSESEVRSDRKQMTSYHLDPDLENGLECEGLPTPIQ